MAVIITLQVMDVELEDQALNVMSRFNGAGAELALFISADPPTPETVLADLDEPTLDGYARVDLEDQWTAPARDEAGVWSAQTEIFTFETDPAEVDEEIVYGVFLILGGEVKAAGLFDAPFTWGATAPLRVRVVYTQWSAMALKVQVLS